MSRNQWSMLVCSAAFFVLAALKMLFPAQAMALSDDVLEILDRDSAVETALLFYDEYFAPAGMGRVAVSPSPEPLAAGRLAEPAAPGPEQTQTEPVPEAVMPEGLLPPFYVYPVDLLGTGVARSDGRTREETPMEEGSELVESAQTEAPAEQTDAPVQQAVETFLDAQLQFADALPETVDAQYYSLGFAWTQPVSGASSSGFGYRLHPVQGVVKFHFGTDIAAGQGDSVGAFADGTVSAVGWDPEGYGNYIMVQHDNGYTTLYAHCSEILASEGERVSMGQTIALVGQTGLATGPHLHFELRRNGIWLNPEYYISGNLAL